MNTTVPIILNLLLFITRFIRLLWLWRTHYHSPKGLQIIVCETLDTDGSVFWRLSNNNFKPCSISIAQNKCVFWCDTCLLMFLVTFSYLSTLGYLFSCCISVYDMVMDVHMKCSFSKYVRIIYFTVQSFTGKMMTVLLN